MEYICRYCQKPFKIYVELLPPVQICSTCKSSLKETIEGQQVLVAAAQESKEMRKRIREQYKLDHPEEYQARLAGIKERTKATKIAKYGSLENAEKARMQKQLETMRQRYPDERRRRRNSVNWARRTALTPGRPSIGLVQEFPKALP